MSGKIQVQRKEVKYYVNPIQHALLSSLLGALLKRDENSDEYGDYFVRSVYFDSFMTKDFNEKEMGVSHRKKVRLRYYEENPDTIKFEVKEKFDKHTIKNSLLVSNSIGNEFMSGEFQSLVYNDETSEFAKRVYDHVHTHFYRPVSIVDYEREAYVSDIFDLRINFDKNIRGSIIVDDVFNKEVIMKPIIDPQLYILEVKYTGHLPDVIQEILTSVDITKVSYSKYYYSLMIHDEF